MSPLLIYLDRFLLGSLAGLAAVAHYTAPFEVTVRLLILPAALASVLFPAFTVLAVRDDHASFQELVAQSLRHLVLLAGVPSLLLIVFARDFVTAWLGPTYADQSTLALQILAAGVFMNSLAHVPFSCLRALGRPDLTAKFHLVELPIHLVVAWFLVGRYGVTGAAMAWTLRVTLDAALLGLGVWAVVGVTPRRLLAHNGGRAIAVVAALGIVLVAIAMGMNGALPRIMFSGLATATVGYFAWHKILDTSERTTVSRLFQEVTSRLRRT